MKFHQTLILVGIVFAAACTPKEDTSNTPPPVQTTDLVADFTVALKPTNVAGYGSLDQGDVTITNTSQNATTFVWDFNDNSGLQTISTNQFTYNYYLPKTYNIKLTATGPKGTKSVTKSITTIAGGIAIFHCSNSTTSFPVTVTCEGRTFTLESDQFNCANCCSTPQNYPRKIGLFGARQGLHNYTATNRYGAPLTPGSFSITQKGCSTVSIQ